MIKLILNLIMLAVILLCVWNGYKRGLVLGIGSLLVIVISLYAADLLSDTYSYEVNDALRPFASGYLETNINQKVREEYGIAGAATGSLSVSDYLTLNPSQSEAFCRSTYEHMGIYGNTAQTMAEKAVAYAAAQGQTVPDAMVEVLCSTLSYVGGFLLFFTLILIFLTVLGNLPNLVFKIPGGDMLNDLGGMVTGILQGLFFCTLFAWVLKFTGVLIPQDTLVGSFLPSILMELDPLAAFLGI